MCKELTSRGEKLRLLEWHCNVATLHSVEYGITGVYAPQKVDTRQIQTGLFTAERVARILSTVIPYWMDYQNCFPVLFAAMGLPNQSGKTNALVLPCSADSPIKGNKHLYVQSIIYMGVGFRIFCYQMRAMLIQCQINANMAITLQINNAVCTIR